MKRRFAALTIAVTLAASGSSWAGAPGDNRQGREAGAGGGTITRPAADAPAGGHAKNHERRSPQPPGAGKSKPAKDAPGDAKPDA